METDEERVEALKKWWKENATSLIAGLVIGLSGLFGWNYWSDYKNNIGGQASAVYTSMMSAVNQGIHEEVQSRAGVLIAKYSDTPYAIYAAMALAKIKVDEGDLEAAASQLRWAMEHASLSGIQHIARLRYVRVLTAQEKHDEALGELSKVDSASLGSFVPVYEELRGDILLRQGKVSEAHAAFTRAILLVDQASQSRPMLQMKLDAIGNPGNINNIEEHAGENMQESTS